MVTFGTTNAYVAEELLGEPVDRGAFAAGFIDDRWNINARLGEMAEIVLENGKRSEMTSEEALVALRASHEAGLVHLAYRKPGEETTVFCSCCSCCCWFLNALKRFDYHDAIVESSHVAKQDGERCIGCGACVERCPFDAWAAARNGDRPSLNPDKCFGCGVCVSGCPVGAISFVPRPVAESAQ